MDGFDLEEFIESKNKNFDDWNEEKKDIFHNGKLKFIKVGQIWMCKVGMNIGGEISKGSDYEFQRPALIVSTFIGGDLVGIIPFSTQPAKKPELKQYVIPFDEREAYGLNKPTNLVINQFKIISIKRLKWLINDVKKEEKIIPLVGRDIINLLLNKFSERILFKTKTSHKD